MKKSALASLLLIGLYGLLLTTAAPAQIANPSGELRPADPELIWAQTMEGSRFNELWNYQFYFDNGTKLYVVFNVANFGSLKSAANGVRMSVINLKGEQFQVAREYPLEELVQDREDHEFRLRSDRDMFFRGELPHEHQVVVRTQKDGNVYDIELTLHNIEPGYMWGDGRFRIGDEKIGIVTHIPYAEVTGYVQVNDLREEVTGRVYMDHTWQDIPTTSLMRSGYRFVSLNDRDNWDVFYFLLPDGSRDRQTLGYRLQKTGGEVQLSAVQRITDIHPGRAFGMNVDRIVELETNRGSSIRITRVEDQEKSSILGELGWLARRAARTFLGGDVIDFRGEAMLHEPGERPVRGEYNFFLVD
ncbi:MAG: hypothetical protein ACNA78_08495 [Balneolaceae bacterium]